MSRFGRCLAYLAIGVLLTAAAACESGDASTASSAPMASETTEVDATATAVASTLPEQATSEPSAPSTTDAATTITRPYIDPSTCGSGLRRGTAVQDYTLYPFAITHEAPIPLQVIAERVDGIAKPFAVVVRLFVSDRDFTSEHPVIVGGVKVNITTYTDENLMAAWTLSDSSTAYVRSRGLDQDALVALIARLVPRAATAPIPGFDLAPPSGTDPIVLLHESLNTALSAKWTTFQCTTVASQGIYYVSVLTGDPVFMYFSVLGTPNLRAVSTNGDGALTIQGGLRGDPSAPTLQQVEQASLEVWSALPVARQT